VHGISNFFYFILSCIFLEKMGSSGYDRNHKSDGFLPYVGPCLRTWNIC